jgi:predicted N-acyltransferase
MGLNRLLVDAGVVVPERVVEAVLDAAERDAGRAGLRSMSFLYVSRQDRNLAAALRRRGYRSFPTGRYAWLDVPAEGFPGYLDSLPADRRRKVERERQRCADAGVTVRQRRPDADLLPRLAGLEMHLMRKYGTPWSAEASLRTLTATAGRFGDRARVFVTEVAGELAGFALFVEHRGHWYGRQTGYDYDVQGDLPLYFETVFYRPLQDAAAHGIRRIHFGLGSEEAKSFRNCTMDDQDAFLHLVDDPRHAAATDPERSAP